MNFNEVIKIFKQTFSGIKEGVKEKSIDHIETELKDLEGAFGMILFASLMGFPSFSPFISISLLPYSEKEIITMLSRSKFFDDFAAFWFDLADI